MAATRTSRREMYAALTKSAIIDAARKLFVERGYDETSVDDIARESNVSKGAVYHHFPDKQQIFADVYRDATAAVTTKVAAEVAGTTADSWDRVEVAARAAIQAYAADADTLALLRQVTRVLGDERTKQLESELALPLIRGLLDEMAAIGQLRPFDTDIAAQLAFRVLCEASLIVAAADDPESAARASETVMLRMLEGLRAPAPES
ncbi:TetR/AcrR family transcriptional regulator [Nocardia cyriacigeorgica]|uniref:TetR/AcrR family transcriptional regulator n=1 Tax=Nocardia cyriacigeorgica TaxID=135487 RepID=UPI00189340A2|nr:TetR/AcrR family transcriptional regulator [Nocardia cyriacigeorgica]MBF6342521.1 TetR/AcrR family transcriptional regulator [Nocardia cyriacigeorgica]